MTGTIPDTDPQTVFNVELSGPARAPRLVLDGELDIAGIPVVEAAIPELAAGDRLTVDLRGLSFIDSSGIRVLMQLDLRARSHGWDLVVVRGRGPVGELLALCRLEERVTMIDAPPAPGAS